MHKTKTYFKQPRTNLSSGWSSHLSKILSNPERDLLSGS